MIAEHPFGLYRAYDPTVASSLDRRPRRAERRNTEAASLAAAAKEVSMDAAGAALLLELDGIFSLKRNSELTEGFSEEMF